MWPSWIKPGNFRLRPFDTILMPSGKDATCGRWKIVVVSGGSGQFETVPARVESRDSAGRNRRNPEEAASRGLSRAFREKSGAVEGSYHSLISRYAVQGGR